MCTPQLSTGALPDGEPVGLPSLNAFLLNVLPDRRCWHTGQLHRSLRLLFLLHTMAAPGKDIICLLKFFLEEFYIYGNQKIVIEFLI